MTESISTRYVPDVGPEDAKIVFVGEAPGADEDRLLEPFIGESGNKLTNCLGRNGLSREEVRLANLFHYRPPRNDFTKIPSDRLSESIEELRGYLEAHKPNVVCTLGNWAFFYLTGRHGKRPGSGILNWRGSILESILVPGLKVVPTVHPAAVLRDASLYPIFDIDIKRVKAESATSELSLPQREYIVIQPGDATSVDLVTERLMNATRLAVDIETFGPRLACVGFSPDPSFGVCVIWSDADFTTRGLIDSLLSGPIPKTFQFGTFDTEYLHHQYNIRVNNWAWDTMIAQHIMEPELPRSLKYLSSVYTREPYYKDEGKEKMSDEKKEWSGKVDRSKLWIYNCKDVCVTSEIQLAQEIEIREGPPAWKEFFDYEMELARDVYPPIMRTGLSVDLKRRKQMEVVLTHEWKDRQEALNFMAGFVINPNSNPTVHKLLYDTFKLPVRTNRQGKKTADKDALISLMAFCMDKVNEVKRQDTKDEWERKALAIKMILLVRETRKCLSSYVLAELSSDNKYRSIYKVAATETGRSSSEKYIDGTGFNAQTVPRDPLEVEDEFYERLLKGELKPVTVDMSGGEDEDEEDQHTINDRRSS